MDLQGKRRLTAFLAALAALTAVELTHAIKSGEGLSSPGQVAYAALFVAYFGGDAYQKAKKAFAAAQAKITGAKP